MVPRLAGLFGFVPLINYKYNDMKTKQYLILLSLFLGVQTFAQTSYIIPDGLGEDAGYLYFRENLGQVQNDSLDSVPEIKFYCTQLESKLWIQEDGLVSWTTLKKAIDDSLPDTNYRIDMQPYMEGDPIDADLLPQAEESTGAVSNYYLPHCGTNGIEGVNHYKRITWPNIYPNIHQQVYSNNTGFKYYYIVEPGGDPDDINIVFTGQDQMVVSPTKMDFYLGQMMMTLDNAIAYEIDNLNQVTLSSWTPTFTDQGNGSITIATGSYNTANTLVIQIGAANLPYVAAANPGNMEYSSYLTADKQDRVKKVTTRSSNGDIYMMGESTSSRFVFANGVSTPLVQNRGTDDIVLFQFKSDMKAKAYTYIGTAVSDFGTGLALDNVGNVYLAGYTGGTSLLKATNSAPSSFPLESGFTAKFSFNLTLLYPTWFGSDANTQILDMEIDNNNKLFIVGTANRNTGNLPVKSLGGSAYYQSTSHSSGGGYDGFIARLDQAFGIDHCTWLGASKNDGALAVDVDNTGGVYMAMYTENTGNNPNPVSGCGVTTNQNLPKCYYLGGAFTSNQQGFDDYYLAKFDANFAMKWGTWVGSTKQESGTYEADIKVDRANTENLYLAVRTESPVTFSKSGATGGFILNPSNDGNDYIALMKFVYGAYQWHTFLGCSGNVTGGVSLEIDDKKNVFVGGRTACDVPVPNTWYCSAPQAIQNKFPLCDNGAQIFLQPAAKSTNANGRDGFLMAFDQSNYMKWSTWFGGGHNDIVNSFHFNASQKRLYSVGTTQSTNIPIPLWKLNVTNSHYQGNMGSSMGGMVSWFDPNLSLSVEMIESENWKVKAYPNPTGSWLHIDLKGEATYQLLDVSGRELQSGKISPEKNALAVGWLSTGTYLLRLQQEGKLATVKFVKE